MQTREQRYLAAVERNLKTVREHYADRYKGLTIARAKQAIGIRQSDTTYDDVVAAIVKGE